MIACSPQPPAIIKAALLARLTGDLPCLKGEEASLGLFGLGDVQDADKADMPALLARLAAQYRIRANWLKGSDGQTLARLIAANLRYRAPDRAALIFAAVDQAIDNGPACCFGCADQISRLFVNRYRAVAREVHQMLGFIRFYPAPPNTLVAQPRLFHDTADLILRQFAPRYPGTRLVLLLEDRALALEGGAITSAPLADYAGAIANDPFAAIWESYYRSQYIASRKNIGLAQRFIPKKYWDWLPEGRILAQEAQK